MEIHEDLCSFDGFRAASPEFARPLDLIERAGRAKQAKT
jgi:hypothetical protein